VSVTHAGNGPQFNAEPRSGLGRKRASAHPATAHKWRWSRALDQAIWTATGALLGFFAAILATFVLFADAYL
jgi:hypothetical protein